MPRTRTSGQGRKKGSVNKNTVAVKEALQAAFQGIGGVPKLIAWAEESPGEFFKLWTKMLPTEIVGDLSLTISLADRLAQARKRAE